MGGLLVAEQRCDIGQQGRDGLPTVYLTLSKLEQTVHSRLSPPMLIAEAGILKSLGSAVEGTERRIGAVRGGALCSCGDGGTVTVMWRHSHVNLVFEQFLDIIFKTQTDDPNTLQSYYKSDSRNQYFKI